MSSLSEDEKARAHLMGVEYVWYCNDCMHADIDKEEQNCSACNAITQSIGYIDDFDKEL